MKFLENKLSSANFIIQKIRHKINKKLAFKLYDTLILPYLNYCNVIWGSLKKTHIKRIECLQKRAIRVCSSRFDLGSKDLFAMAKKLPFEKLSIFATLKLVHRYFYNPSTLPHSILSLFQRSNEVHQHLTRSAVNLNLFSNYGRLDARKNSIKIYAPMLWNSIPSRIRNVNSNLPFKIALKSHLFASTFFV